MSPNQARTLEKEAHPALDKLTSGISTLNLERVRQIKSRLVAITGRVQKVALFSDYEPTQMFYFYIMSLIVTMIHCGCRFKLQITSNN